MLLGKSRLFGPLACRRALEQQSAPLSFARLEPAVFAAGNTMSLSMPRQSLRYIPLYSIYWVDSDHTALVNFRAAASPDGEMAPRALTRQ